MTQQVRITDRLDTTTVCIMDDTACDTCTDGLDNIGVHMADDAACSTVTLDNKEAHVVDDPKGAYTADGPLMAQG